MSEHHYQPIKSGSLGNFLDGYARVPRRAGRRLSEAQQSRWAAREARVAAATEFLADLIHGRTPAYFLREVLMPSSPEVTRLVESNYPGLVRPAIVREGVRGGDDLFTEAMSVSDFPYLMGDVLDRMLLARYGEVPQVWRNYISVGSPLRDFRTVKMLETTGGNDEWETISELEGLTYTSIGEGKKELAPELYGKAIRLSWRLMMNDDLDAFRVIPSVLARGGRRTINRFATDLVFDSTGPDAAIFTTGQGNRLSGNPAFSITSLGAAITALMSRTDSEGEPIAFEGVRLVHGPGLAVSVNNVLNALEVQTTSDGGAAAGRELKVSNWIKVGITPVMDPYIPAVVTGGNAATSWMLTANPDVDRPLARIRFLQGFETPALYQKAPNTQRVGGGIDPEIGDFQSMASEFKGLVAFGGVTLEPLAAVASNGSGS